MSREQRVSRSVTEADISTLQGTLGHECVHTDDRSLERASGDALADRSYRKRPGCVVRPENAGQVSRLLEWASGEGVPVTTRGAGSGLAAGAVPSEGAVVLDMSRMNSIKEIDVNERIAVVEPGVVTGKLDKALEPHGLFFAGYPMSSGISQIGGNIATNAGGGRALKYGVTGAHVLGMRVVTGNGSELVLGGRRRKDVVGYDLRSLFIGSEGTLGVIVEATLSLMPRPSARSTVLAGFDSPAGAVEALGRISREAASLPSSAELLDAECIRLGAAAKRVEPPSEKPWVGLFEFDGATEEEAARGATIAFGVLKSLGAADVTGPDSDVLRGEWWGIREAVPWALKKMTRSQGVEDISLPISAVDSVLTRMRELGEAHGLTTPSFGHIGDGNMHIHPMVAEGAEDWKAREKKFLSEFYPVVVAAGGTISGEHGVGLKRAGALDLVFSEDYREMLRQVKAVFDPVGILNPGKAI